MKTPTISNLKKGEQYCYFKTLDGMLAVRTVIMDGIGKKARLPLFYKFPLQLKPNRNNFFYIGVRTYLLSPVPEPDGKSIYFEI